ncbi:KNL1 protein, partial [Amazona guildingii]|nr:KNL1 protein [Amazona guildingii]
MEKVYADPNLENDNTENIRGKRLSSILKAPRNALDDLGNGNELTQDINIERRRRNSRRVSFANTIKVFQPDLKNNTAERENKGMNTLLHAPIQALVQQTEWYDADDTTQRQNGHNTTFIFSEENEMDMTASHTAVITRNLKNNQADNTEKIDIKSFLAGLNSNSGKAEGSKEFQFFSDPASHLCPPSEQKEDAATRKIDFSEFLMSLKSNEKTVNPMEGPEKENVFFIPSRVPEAVAPSSVEFAYSHEPLDTCNVTKVFREEDDGIEVTKCQGSFVKAIAVGAMPGAVSSETVFRGDKTVDVSKCEDMEITGNYTDVICSDSTKEMNSSHLKAFDKPVNANAVLAEHSHVASDGRDIAKTGQTVSSEEAFESSHGAGGLCLRGAEEPVQATASEPHTGRAQVPSLFEKSVVFPSGENMDLTGNVTAALSARKAVPGFSVQDENQIISLSKGVTMTVNPQEQPGSAAPADKTIVFTHNQEDMEITASHTVAVNNNISGLEQE